MLQRWLQPNGCRDTGSSIVVASQLWSFCFRWGKECFRPWETMELGLKSQGRMIWTTIRVFYCVLFLVVLVATLVEVTDLESGRILFFKKTQVVLVFNRRFSEPKFFEIIGYFVVRKLASQFLKFSEEIYKLLDLQMVICLVPTYKCSPENCSQNGAKTLHHLVSSVIQLVCHIWSDFFRTKLTRRHTLSASVKLSWIGRMRFNNGCRNSM